MFKNCTVVIGVTGGIAAYKVCTLVSMLKQARADVHVVMTQHATEFVSPLTFETLSGNRVVVDTFDRDFNYEVEHVSLAASANIFVVAPATGNFLGKMSSGIADDFLTTTAMAMKCPIVLCPAMNMRMISSAATSANLKTLSERGMHVLYGHAGYLACGETGEGRMAEPTEIFNEIKKLMLPKQDLVGKKVLITSGATREDIDGVRCITNYSSGKMGSALADAAVQRGATVTVIEGFATTHPVKMVKLLHVDTTQAMYDAVLGALPDADIIIKAAAPSDYKVVARTDNKIKGEHVTLQLEKNPDIAAAVGKKKSKRQKLIIFCAETRDLVESAREKMVKKGADLVVANDVSQEGIGFDSDQNAVTLIGENVFVEIERRPKTEIANVILDQLGSLN